MTTIKRQDTYDETFPPFDNFQNTCTCQVVDFSPQTDELKRNIYLIRSFYCVIHIWIYFHFRAIRALAGPVKGMTLIFLNPASPAHSSKSVRLKSKP